MGTIKLAKLNTSYPENTKYQIIEIFLFRYRAQY